MSYFEDGDIVPPPFNIIPTSKSFQKLLKCGNSDRSTRSYIVNNFIRTLNSATVTERCFSYL